MAVDGRIRSSTGISSSQFLAGSVLPALLYPDHPSEGEVRKVNSSWGKDLER